MLESLVPEPPHDRTDAVHARGLVGEPLLQRLPGSPAIEDDAASEKERENEASDRDAQTQSARLRALRSRPTPCPRAGRPALRCGSAGRARGHPRAGSAPRRRGRARRRLPSSRPPRRRATRLRPLRGASPDLLRRAERALRAARPGRDPRGSRAEARPRRRRDRRAAGGSPRRARAPARTSDRAAPLRREDPARRPKDSKSPASARTCALRQRSTASEAGSSAPASADAGVFRRASRTRLNERATWRDSASRKEATWARSEGEAFAMYRSSRSRARGASPSSA